MEKKEMRDRLVQLCVKAYMFGSEQVIIDLPSLIGFVEEELDKAREEGMFTEDEIWTLSALVESKIDEIWDTMTLGTEKIVQEQSDDLHRLLSKLTTK